MIQTPHYLSQQIGWLGAIAGVMLVFYPTTATAQIAGDGTLGTQVNGALTAPCTGTCIITDGSTRGRNLFHSFRQFSLPNGDFAGFVTTPTIQNVIVRVTGVGQPFISNINGTIATINAAGTAINPANFFLLNPNGIVFGPGATLNIGGSFLATIANRMQFADGTEFRTNDPAPLLTVSVPIGLQFGSASGSIQMQGSFLSAGNTDSFSDFVLVGGDVILDNTIVQTPGRRVELAGVGENGMVGLRLNDDRLSLSLPTGTSRQDITLTNRSVIDASASNGGGEVVVMGRNILLGGGSVTVTGILSGADNAAANQAGDITIDATANLQLTQASLIINQVNSNATGQGGNIRIAANDIRLRGGSTIGTNIVGTGDAGTTRVTANTISVDGTTPDGLVSGIFSEVAPTGRGRVGDVIIQARSFAVTNGAAVSASTYGIGNAGTIRVIANTVSVDGTTPDGQFVSGIFGRVEFTGNGRGGDITVETDSLTLTNGAVVSSSTDGTGDAGNVRVTASTITLDSSPRYGLASGISSQVRFTGHGRGGDVTVQTSSLTVSSGAVVSSSTFGNGNAGNVQVTANTIALDGTTPGEQEGPSGIFSEIASTGSGQGGSVTVQTGSLTVTNGAAVSASTFGNGNAGNVQVTANTIALDGTTPDEQGSSGIFSQVAPTVSGQGGNITVQTGSLNVTNGAGISVSTFGKGNAGNIRVVANTIVLDGIAPDGQGASSIDSAVGSTGSGRGGDVAIETDLLTVSNRALISASTFGNGDAGSILVTANVVDASSGGQIRTSTASGNKAGAIVLNVSDRLTLSGTNTGLFANTALESSGNGGSIFIDPRTVPIQDGATLAVDSQGSGIGGNISIQAGRLELRDRGSITAETASAQGGNIALDVKDLMLLRRNSLISATAGTAQAGGDGGNITIQTPFIIGVLSENSDIVANAFTGRGGNINITTNAIYGLQFQPQLTPFSDITASSQFGINGTVAINTLNVDPNRGLVALPVNFTDPTQQISQDCRPGSKTSASSFVATGRGGIPLSPDEPLESQAIVTKWVPLPEMGRRGVGPVDNSSPELAAHNPFSNSTPNSQLPTPLVEAQGWTVNADGSVELVANEPNELQSNVSNVWIALPTCETLQGN